MAVLLTWTAALQYHEMRFDQARSSDQIDRHSKFRSRQKSLEEVDLMMTHLSTDRTVSRYGRYVHFDPLALLC